MEHVGAPKSEKEEGGGKGKVVNEVGDRIRVEVLRDN